jgi:hypothetical protein
MPTTSNSKLPYPASTDPADVPTDLQKLAAALDELAYVEFTASVTISATTEATANTIVTAAAVTFDGVTPVIIEFFAPYVSTAATAAAAVIVNLFDGASAIGALGNLTNPTGTGGLNAPMRLARRLTPSAAAHTYGFRAFAGGGNGGVGAGPGGSGAYMPGFIRIRRA